MFPAKVIRNQPELFERCFEVVDDFLGDEDSNLTPCSSCSRSAP
jgi:hypothetical protein